MNCRLSEPTRHVVVEANPGLLPILERQRQLNGARFSVEHAAIDYSGAATTTLNVSDGFIAGRVGTGGPGGPVVTTTLARLFERHQWTGITPICDIEGLETDLVDHEGEIIEHHCKTVVIEVHPEFRTEEARARMFKAVQRRGFRPARASARSTSSRAEPDSSREPQPRRHDHGQAFCSPRPTFDWLQQDNARERRANARRYVTSNPAEKNQGHESCYWCRHRPDGRVLVRRASRQ